MTPRSVCSAVGWHQERRSWKNPASASTKPRLTGDRRIKCVVAGL